MTGTKGMPTYVVLDVSTSMRDYELLLNESLIRVLDTLFKKPRISEFIQLSILTFSTEPNVVLRMTELRGLQRIPKITCGGATNFGKVFDLLHERIDADLPLLQRSGFDVLRPIVFLFTDGAPTDRPQGSWRQAHSRLTDPDWAPHPHILCYGFDQAVESILRDMCTIQSYIADGSREHAEALAEAMETMLNSVVASASAKELRIPENVRGYRTISSEPLDL